MGIDFSKLPDCTIQDKWDLEENYDEYYEDDEYWEKEGNSLKKLIIMEALKEDGSL